jgi:hypothetical protein
MSSDKGAGAMPKGWDESPIESCCKNDKGLLIAGVIIGIIAIISAILIFIPIEWPSDYSLNYITIYCVVFFVVGILFTISYYIIQYYCDQENDDFDRLLALIGFCIFVIVAILLCFVIIDNIEKTYHQAHLNNALKYDTLQQVYSELDCKIIDKFRDNNFDNQPVWESKNKDWIKGSIDPKDSKYLIHQIPVPEVCMQ